MKAKKISYLFVGMVGSVALAVLVGVLLQFAVEAMIGVFALCFFLILFIGAIAG